MAIPSIPITVRDVTIVIRDGTTPTPLETTIQYEGEGTFSVDGVKEGNLDLDVFRDRDVIYALREGPQQPETVSLELDATTIYEGTDKIAADAIQKTGAFAAGVSTWGTNAADPWTVEILVTFEGTDRGAGSDQTWTFPYFRGECGFKEGRPAKWSITGTAYPKSGTAASTRT